MTRIMPDGWAIPEIDAFNGPFFTSGRVVIQECVSCGTMQHPPEEVCHRCLGMEFLGRETSGIGTIDSYIVVHHPVAPALASVVPYTVVLVGLKEFPDVRVIGNVVNRAPEQVAIGQTVRAVFEKIDPGGGESAILLPQWEVTD